MTDHQSLITANAGPTAEAVELDEASASANTSPYMRLGLASAKAELSQLLWQLP